MPDPIQPVRVIKADTLKPKRDTIPADRIESALRTLEHIEAQAGRLLKMAQAVRAELTTK